MAPETRDMKVQQRLCSLEWIIGQKKCVRIKVLRERKGESSRKRETPQRRATGMERGKQRVSGSRRERGKKGGNLCLANLEVAGDLRSLKMEFPRCSFKG